MEEEPMAIQKTVEATVILTEEVTDVQATDIHLKAAAATAILQATATDALHQEGATTRTEATDTHPRDAAAMAVPRRTEATDIRKDAHTTAVHQKGEATAAVRAGTSARQEEEPHSALQTDREGLTAMTAGTEAPRAETSDTAEESPSEDMTTTPREADSETEDLQQEEARLHVETDADRLRKGHRQSRIHTNSTRLTSRT